MGFDLCSDVDPNSFGREKTVSGPRSYSLVGETDHKRVSK